MQPYLQDKTDMILYNIPLHGHLFAESILTFSKSCEDLEANRLRRHRRPFSIMLLSGILTNTPNCCKDINIIKNKQEFIYFFVPSYIQYLLPCSHCHISEVHSATAPDWHHCEDYVKFCRLSGGECYYIICMLVLVLYLNLLLSKIT